MGTYLVGGIVILCVFFAARSIYKDKKQGKCSCGCSGCGAAGICHSRKAK